MKRGIYLIFLFTILSVSLVSAEFYEYDIEAPVDGSGYIKPYKKGGMLGTYAYLKYKRYGYPEGNTYPLPLVEDQTYSLPWGLENVYLKVKVNEIKSSGVDLDVDTSQIIPTTTTSIVTTSTVTVTTTHVTTTTSTVYLPPSAGFYEYNVESKIVVDGEELGYIKPYKQASLGVTQVWLKYRRYGYPEGTALLVKGLSTPLPFGLANIYLKVKLYDARENGVYMDVDTSQIIATTTSSVYTTSTSTVTKTTTSTTTVPLPSSAKFVKYDEEDKVVVGGEELGYIKPYSKTGVLGTYAYLKYRREGFPEGDTFPLPLTEGNTLPLPFGLDNVYLKVKVYRIQDDGVYLEFETDNPLPTTLPTTTSSTTIPSFASLYKYNTQESVISSGKEIGYIKPYQKTGPLGTFTYLEYRREGFPKGDTFPLPLNPGNLKLPFGLDNVYLNVTVYSITDEGVYMTVNTPNIISTTTTIPVTTTTITIPPSAILLRYDTENAVNYNGTIFGYIKPYKKSTSLGPFTYLKYRKYPRNEIEYGIAVTPLIPIKLFYGSYTDYYRVYIYEFTDGGVWADVSVKETVKGITKTKEELDLLEDQLSTRIDKFVNRGYYSSIHITGKDAQEIDPRVSREMEKMELDIAENIGDTITPLLSGLAGHPELAKAYCKYIKYVPEKMRNDLTKYLLNIETHNYTQHRSDAELSTLGAFTISVGGPSVNPLSVQINEDLKMMGLPHFEKKEYGTVLIGEQEYTDPSIAVIAALPEEIIWKKDTLNERWKSDKIRFYRTMIAGLEGEGTQTGMVWYNDQLRMVKGVLGLIKESLCFAGKIDFPTEESNSKEIFEFIDDTSEFIVNQSSELDSHTSKTQMQSSKALMQGWYLAAMDILQEGDVNGAPSAGYVVIIQKQGNSYKLLESHSIIGNKVEKVM